MAVRIATLPGLIVPILISDREADILSFEILDEEVTICGLPGIIQSEMGVNLRHITVGTAARRLGTMTAHERFLL